MAADYGLLTENLHRFYDFTDKVLLFVGAGGGQLLDPAIPTKKLIAIDQDAHALKELKMKIVAEGRQNSVEVIANNFENVILIGDVVYFEFCLHEMTDPRRALAHASMLAPDIVVFDHSPVSDWIFYAAEEDKVCSSTKAIKRFGVRRSKTFRTEQRFSDYAELLAKVTGQGPLAIQRAQRFMGATNFAINMDCELALL